MNIDKDIEILKEFKEKGYASLMIKYNKDRIRTNTMVEIALENVLKELETYKKENKTQINNTHILQSQLDVANAEKIEWKKIAEKMVDKILELDYENNFQKVFCNNIPKNTCDKYGDDKCNECIMDWARKEVEKDDL